MSSDPSAGSRRLLIVLTTINFLNYVDRQVLFAVFPAVQTDLGLSDAELGLLASAFIVIYMLSAPVTGFAGDRFRRLPIVATSVALWSGCTALTGFARSFSDLLLTRAAVGIGESGYAPSSSALIADSFPPEQRASRLGIFNLAIPVGSALGYLLGGVLGAAYGWRAAFFLVGMPGLLLAGLSLRLVEPARGAHDAESHTNASRDYRALLSNPVYLTTNAAMAALTFVLGALAAWMPTFLVRVHGLSMGAAGSAFGLLTVLTGVVGTMAGGMLGDRALRGHPAGYLWVSAAGLFLAVPATWIAIRVDVPVLFWTFAAIAETLVFLNTGPLNAVIVSVADANTRAMAVGANVLFIHLFGDALSPWLVGTLSDRFGIRSALEVMAPALLLSGLLCVVAGRVLTASASARSSDGG